MCTKVNKMHLSIVSVGSGFEIQRCSSCCKLYHCPLCPHFKPAKLNRLKRHLDVHLKNAVAFQNFRICRCGLDCRSEGHYHCPYCQGTLLRRNSFLDHLEWCKGLNGCEMLVPLKFTSETKFYVPQLQQARPSSPSHQIAESAHSSCQEDENVHFSDQDAQPARVLQLKVEAGNSSVQEDEPACPSPPLKTSEVNCPYCPLLFSSNTLNNHIYRKHRDISRDITLHSHLRSVCVDAINGIAAVQKAVRGVVSPIHVQNKTWGRHHLVKCELEECRQNQLLARQSGLVFHQCQHIRSLDYCTETAAEDFLHAAVLDEMVACKLFGAAKKTVCLKRQQLAKAAHTPFSVLVDLGMSPNCMSVSIYEPANVLGRVMVTYNKMKNTWHCPCAKQHMSCTHKNIAKWHLFQIDRELFHTPVNTVKFI